MRLHEILSEHKKGRRAVKHNAKPRNPVAHAAQTVAKGSGPHKDKKKAAKQGDVKHKAPVEIGEAGSPAQQAAIAINMKKHHKKPKSESLGESTSWGTMGGKAAQQMLAAFKDASHGVEHFSNDEAAVQRIYDALKDTAREHQVVPQLKSLLNSAQHYAHQEFDTNPGSFKNWWQFVGQFLESLVDRYKEKGELEDEPDFVLDTNESAPKGWEGTVKAMKKHKDIDNPWALAHWMKNKGYKSHKKEQVEEKKKYPFAGAKVGQKEGPAGQLRTGPAKAGKLVGGGV